MTKRAILIGHPVGHSISPTFQQAAFDHLSLDAVYEAMDVDASALPEVMESLRGPDVIGANVTVPHKEAVIPFLDEAADDVLVIGAANTIVNRDGVLVGYNTDVAGFIRSLRERGGFEPAGKSALVLGAGGAARAVAVALAGEGAASIFIANRTVERAQALLESLRPLGNFAEAVPMNTDAVRALARSSQIIVNCTSMGMTGGPEPDGSPLKAEDVPSHALVFDLVYNPRETPLLREAVRAGARVLGGLSMLVYQGAASFELWTRQEAPLDVMFHAAEKALVEHEPARR